MPNNSKVSFENTANAFEYKNDQQLKKAHFLFSSMGYNWLVRRNKVAMEEVHAFGADLHAVLLGSAESGSAQK